MRRNMLLPAPDPDLRATRIAGALFFATCTSVFFVRLFFWEPAVDGSALVRAWIFAATLMAILLAHELGHWLVARHHGFKLSLPWFLPAPILVGTFGAVIRLEEAPRTRAGLLEMGAAGPLAGMAVAWVAMALRLGIGGGQTGGSEVAAPLLWQLSSVVLTGSFVPVDTADPVAFAAWLGCLLTAMNLLPFGQLDGGHILAALTPRFAAAIGWVTTAVLLVAGFLWPGWAIWAGLLHLMGARHPVQVRKDTGFPWGRPVWVALAAACIWLLAVVPVPL